MIGPDDGKESGTHSTECTDWISNRIQRWNSNGFNLNVYNNWHGNGRTRPSSGRDHFWRTVSRKTAKALIVGQDTISMRT